MGPERHVAAPAQGLEKSALRRHLASGRGVVQWGHRPANRGVFGAALEGNRPLPGCGDEAAWIERLRHLAVAAEPDEAGHREQDRVEAALAEAANAGVDVAPKVGEDEIGPGLAQLRLPPEARGRQRTEPALNIDIAPTALDLAGVPVPESMSGRSLMPLVRGQEVAWREDFFCENNFCTSRQYYPMIEGVRTMRWKYIRFTDVRPAFEQLFDLENDPHEVDNLAGRDAHAKRLASLRRRCDQLRDDAVALRNRE